MALGRKVDSQITTILTSTTQATVTLTVSTKANILATALEFQEADLRMAYSPRPAAAAA